MNISGNTILITGGGSGIGLGLAKAFHEAGNQVIIAGRRQQALQQAMAAHPGLKSLTLDIQDPESIRAAAIRINSEFPKLNVLINNAGIMRPENLRDHNVSDAEAMVATNLLGPIRLTAALLPLLTRQPQSTIMMVSSGLAFVPLSMTPTYCATKAAIHSYAQSLRWQLRQSSTQVVELIPPYVATELMGPHQTQDPRAMPLAEFVSEVMQIIKSEPSAEEINVERVKPLRFAGESGKYDETFQRLNESMPATH